jgi:hypothetical protein
LRLMQKVSVSSRMKRVLFRKIAICLGFTSNSKRKTRCAPFPGMGDESTTKKIGKQINKCCWTKPLVCEKGPEPATIKLLAAVIN